MPYPIERKLVIAVASSALFDLEQCDAVFENEGVEEYRKYQRDNINAQLEKGVAFPFIRRLLNLNKIYSDQEPMEVVLLSRNDPDTGLRVFRSIQSHGLDITRAGFLSGKSPFEYIPAFNASLFLSANADDVKQAIEAGHPAGTVLRTGVTDDETDGELRVAFDFDGVIVDDEAETVFKQTNDLTQFHDSEVWKSATPHHPGPLEDLFKKLSYFQQIEKKREEEDPHFTRTLRIAIVSARNAPSHERLVTTLRQWGVSADETFFLGGIDKSRVLEIMKPHIYFDDQMSHLDSEAGSIPSVHIPFGVANKAPKSTQDD